LEEALARDEKKATSELVWEKRENPTEFWNEKSQEL